MSNSSLVDYIKISPNSTKPRTSPIRKITIHHMAGDLSVETCGDVFSDPSRQASSNYGIGSDGRVGMYVEEANRSWASSNSANDQMAITIEVANDEIGGNWHVSDAALSKLIDLCVDICQRNNIERLTYTGDTSGNLTMHKWFASTTCPGPYLESKFPYIANEVNKRLQESATSNAFYRVQVGAFKSKANAEKLLKQLKDAGFTGFITTPVSAPTKESSSASLNVGDEVKLSSDAVVYGGTKKFASWIYSSTLYVRQIDGDRIVVSTQKTGAVTGAVHKQYLTKI